MPASYVHQCIGETAASSLNIGLLHAVRAGAEGPDPFFFSLFALPGQPAAPRIGSLLHTRRTADFLTALLRACSSSSLLRAFACGFVSHYATDTTFHPFVYAHSLTNDGAYSGTVHCTLEHQLETLHYRRQGHETGLPVQMGGYASLSSMEKDEIAAALTKALDSIFPEENFPLNRVRRSFDDAVLLCRLLRSEGGLKFRALGAILKPFGLDAPLHAHMMPVSPPDADIANDAHAPWRSIWKPDEERNESFSDLYAAAVSRAQTLMRSACAFMDGMLDEASLRAALGDLSYDSGLAWQQTSPAAQAPGIRKR